MTAARLSAKKLPRYSLEFKRSAVKLSPGVEVQVVAEGFSSVRQEMRHMAEKTVAQKARVKPGATIAVINRVPGIVESLGLPEDVAFVKPAAAQLVFLFVRTRAELEAQMPRAVAALSPGSAIWVFFRKGSKDAGLDMNRNTIWSAAEKLDMRPLGLVGVNELWSAFRLRRAG